MLRHANLQVRLIGAFLLMGAIVLIVALLGWNGSNRLEGHLQTLGENNLPRTIALWKINEGQTQIESGQRLLLNPNISDEERQNVVDRIELAWEQIETGFTAYENTIASTKESPQTALQSSDPLTEQYTQFQKSWDDWKASHEQFMALEEQFHALGIRNPWARQVQLLSANEPPDRLPPNLQQALQLRRQLDLQRSETKPLFDEATQAALALLEANETLAAKAQAAAQEAALNTTFWVWIGLAIGPITAIVLGFALSRAIAQPLMQSISMISSSSAQIDAATAQQAQIANQQAASISETTTTINELGSSSQVSAQHAESSANNASKVLNMVEEGAQGAHQVLHLANDGSKVVGETLEAISLLQEKVRDIADQTTRLGEQIAQIGTIVSAIAEIANQTNMLALNAAVEAVRAGEHGKGFSVVAAEIRKLADKSKQSTEKINTIVADIQNALSATVMVTDEGRDNAKQVVGLSRQTAGAFEEVTEAIDEIVLSSQDKILQAMDEVVKANQQISLTAQQQALAVEQVTTAVNDLNNGARENASGISQTRVSIQGLKEAAMSLKGLVGGQSSD